MASSLISGAVALILIITGGYVIAGGILTIAETVTLTQADMTLTQEKIRQTDLNISSSSWSDPTFSLSILNTGTTSFNKEDAGIDLFVCNDQNVTSQVTTFTRTIGNDITNKGIWDPSEILIVTCTFADTPIWTKIVTPNGVSASKNL